MAGDSRVARHFPFRIGRAAGNDLRLDETGSGISTSRLDFKKRKVSNLQTAPNALATVNGEPLKSTRLRNGDIISLGSAKIQFWLAPPSQRGLRARENFSGRLLFRHRAIAMICSWLLRTFDLR